MKTYKNDSVQHFGYHAPISVQYSSLPNQLVHQISIPNQATIQVKKYTLCVHWTSRSETMEIDCMFIHPSSVYIYRTVRVNLEVVRLCTSI